MKGIILGVLVIWGVAGNAYCAEITATITKTGKSSIITCSPVGSGEIEKAYLTIYASDDQPLSFNRQEMNVSYDNKATYELPGIYDVLEGKCKFIMADRSNKILREEFLVSM